jgi:hypothetical protein
MELKHPNKAIDFRGSLIDENMFAIDVLEWGKRDVMEEYRLRADSIHAEGTCQAQKPAEQKKSENEAA